MIYKYIGNGKSWPHVPAHDLTKEDLKRMKYLYGADEKDIEASGLYEKVKPKRKVKDE